MIVINIRPLNCFKLFSLFLLLFTLSISSEAQSPNCNTATQMCPDQGQSYYPATTGVPAAEPGNNYGCLITTPNPAWFYLTVSSPGTAVVTMTNSANVDIDYALWGPFSSLTAALSSCGSLGAPVSCSYSPAPVEVATFPSSLPGDVYLLLITNYSNQPTNISAGDPAGPASIFSCVPPCEPEGGSLLQPDVSSCFGNPALNLNFTPSGSNPPPGQYGYTFLITNPSGIIVSMLDGPNMTGTPPGVYQVCGLSYLLTDQPLIVTALGQDINALIANLTGPSPLFCGDVSDVCVNVTISPPIQPTILPTEYLCIGECMVGPDGAQICQAGNYSYTFQSYQGCDSVVQLIVLPLTEGFSTMNIFVCEGECVTINGQQICPPGPVIQTLTAANGCDSLLTIYLTELFVDAVITPNPPPQLTCANPSVILLGLNSIPPGGIFTWLDGNQNSVGSGLSFTVTQPGNYSLDVAVNQNNVVCRDVATVTITGNALSPDLVVVDHPEICEGDSIDLNTVPIVDNNNTGGVITFHSSTPANVGNQIDPVVSPNSTTTYYVLSTIGACFGETDLTVTVNPQPNINVVENPVICEGETFDLATLTIEDINMANGVITFHSATPANASNILSSTVVSPNVSTTFYVLSEAGFCSDETSVIVQVNDVPSSTFNLPAQVCIGDNISINYTGSGTPNANFNWNYNGGQATPGTGPGPHQVFWTSIGVKSVTLEVTENSCSSAIESHDIEVYPEVSPPVINCQEFLDSIQFTWTSDPNASNYQFNILSGQPGQQNVNEVLVSGLGQGESVTIEVTALSGSPCPDVIDTLTCIAQNCPEFQIDISPVNEICLDANAAAILLDVSVSGGVGGGIGTWSGNGISNPGTGEFDPLIAGPGTHTLIYNYVEGNCSESGSIAIVVNQQPTAIFTVDTPVCEGDFSNIQYAGNASTNADYSWNFDNGVAQPGTGAGPHDVYWDNPGMKQISLTVTENNCLSEPFSQNVEIDAPLVAPLINCIPSIDSIQFTWNDILNATSYEVFVNGSLVTTQNNTSFTVHNLSPGDNVAFRVVAISGNSCPDAIGSTSCTAQDCPDFDFQFITVDPICLDAAASPIQLSATISGGIGNGVSEWNGDGITDMQNGIFDPAIAGPGDHLISLLYTEGNCSESAPLFIEVIQQPEALFTLESPVCENDLSLIEFTGSAQPDADFQWSFDGGDATPGTGRGPHLVSWTTLGNYNVSLILTENNCASEPGLNIVEVEPAIPEPTINCLSTETSVTFEWDAIPGIDEFNVIIDGILQGTQSETFFMVDNLMPGASVEIEVEAISNGVCPNVSSILSCNAVNCPPVTADILTIVDTICVGDMTTITFNISGGSGGSYDVVWLANGVQEIISNINFGYTLDVNPNTTTTYEVIEIIDLNFPDCEYLVADELTVVVREPLSAGVGDQVSYCQTEELIISLEDLLTGADPGGSWVEASTSFSAGDAFDPITGTFTIGQLFPSLYIFRYIVSNPPCPAETSDVEITVNRPVQAGTVDTVLSYCYGGIDTVPLFWLLTGPDFGGIWTETSEVPSSRNGFNPATGTFMTTGQQPGVYSFKYAVSGIPPCPDDEVEISVEIMELPVASASDLSLVEIDCNDPTAVLGGNSTSSGASFTYEWLNENQEIIGNQRNVEVSDAGIYTLVVSNEISGCSSSDQVEVIAHNTNPVPYISVSAISCFGYNDGTISIDSVSGGMAPYLYSLNGQPFVSNPQFSNLSPNSYSITIEDAYGCTAALQFNLEDPEQMVVDLYVYQEQDGTISFGDSIDLQASVNISNEEVDSVQWSPPELFNNCRNCLNQTVLILETTTFSVQVISDEGCLGADLLNYFVQKDRPVYIPTAFSPNDDGINDFFQIYTGSSVTKVKSFLVFDRWGETIFDQYDFNPREEQDHGWNGRYRGKRLDPGVFAFFAEIEFIDGETEIYKGDVTLIR